MDWADLVEVFGFGFPNAMFGDGLNLKEWTGIIVDLIDAKKKIRIFYIKK